MLHYDALCQSHGLEDIGPYSYCLLWWFRLPAVQGCWTLISHMLLSTSLNLVSLYGGHLNPQKAVWIWTRLARIMVEPSHTLSPCNISWDYLGSITQPWPFLSIDMTMLGSTQDPKVCGAPQLVFTEMPAHLSFNKNSKDLTYPSGKLANFGHRRDY